MNDHDAPLGTPVGMPGGLADEPGAERDSDAPAALVRQIAEWTPVVTVVAALPDFRIVYANQAAHRAASCAGGLTGRLFADAFPFADPISLARRPPNRPASRVVPDRTKGAVVWWELSCVTLDIPGSAGEPDKPAVLITAVDVTHHEAARAAARTAEDTLDALLSYLPEGISISCGPDVHVDRISARGMALVGRGAAELTGQSALRQIDVWEVYAPGGDVPLPPADRPLARATRTGEATINETLVVRRPDGSRLTVLCNSGPIRDADGRVTGAVMAWHDVSELHRAQAALRESEERMRAVLLQIPAAVFVLEPPDGRLTFKSRILDDVLGNPETNWTQAKDSLRGWAVHADGSPYELADYPSRRALFDGATVRAEPMAYWRGDGRLIDLEIHAGPVRNPTGQIIAAVTVAFDVTSRRLQEARQAFLLQLQDSLRALTEPQAILTEAATRLGRHLAAARITYSEVQPDDQTMLITNGYVDGMPPLNGLFPLTIFGPEHAARLQAGQTVVYEDVQAETFATQAIGGQLGSRAHVTVPLVRDGRYTGSLCVTHLKPHRWAPDEIALIEEVAARIWDAAERGRAEVRLRDSEERLRLVMDSTGLGTWEYDAITGKTIRSARHDEIFGYTAPSTDWGYEQFNRHIPDPDRSLVEAGFRAALEQGKDWEVECRMIRTDDSQGWLTIRARPHYGPNGQVARLLGTVADITARKQTEAAALETAAKFEVFAQTMPSMVWTSLPDGRIDWFNARVPEYCGIPADELKPDGWTPVHPDDMETATRLWLEALSSGQRYVAEYRIRRHDGEYRWHLTRAVPIRDADGRITRWVGTSADIQDQKTSEQALAELNATLENQVLERTADLMAAEATLRQSQKMEAVGQLTGGLAHDFNNLLTAISGSLELLETRLAQGRVTELDRYLHVAQGAAKRAAALTHRLLAFSRRQTLDPKPTDINRLIFDMDDLIRRTVSPAVTVTVAGATALWAVLVDPNQLENALLNLCINARDAMPDGGSLIIETANCPLDDTQAKALELQPGAYVSLSVADTGSGMTEDVIACAFDPFFTTKPIGEGTGLGLSMVYGFVRQSGGQARISSEPGKGTQVSLYLPRYAGENGVAEPHDGRQTAPRGDGETVLVVDDEPSLRMLVTEVLEGLGYSVVEAADGASGLRILESGRRVDLLITDVGLPGGMNGRQLADAGLVARPDLKILFITGYAENAVIGEGQLKPAMHIVTKPFSLETLGRRIREIIAAG
jgi:PAS domain S-box-containing protein